MDLDPNNPSHYEELSPNRGNNNINLAARMIHDDGNLSSPTVQSNGGDKLATEVTLSNDGHAESKRILHDREGATANQSNGGDKLGTEVTFDNDGHVETRSISHDREVASAQRLSNGCDVAAVDTRVLDEPVNDVDDEGETTSTECHFCIKEGHFTVVDGLLIVVGMFMYVGDLAFDLVLAVQYFRQGKTLWSALTFVFVLLPSVVLQYFSFRWFMSDMTRETDDGRPEEQTVRRRLAYWCEWLLSHILQLGTIKRYWRHLKYGYKSQHDSKSRDLMIAEYRDITMLRVLEAFLESAPQLVLQIYIMLETEEVYWLTAVSAVLSLLSLSSALAMYHKALRDARHDKHSISWVSILFRVGWRLLTITARVLAMALFAAVYEWWIFVVAGVHWLVMTAWLIWQKTDFCDSNRYEEVFFDAIIGVIHVFCFFNMKEGRTRYRALLFYGVVFVENTLMIAMWYTEQESREKMYGLPALVVVWGCFFLGIFLMMFYYRFYHPTGRLPLCLKRVCDETEIDQPEKSEEGRAEHVSYESMVENRSVPRDLEGATEVDSVVRTRDGMTERKSVRREQYDHGNINLFSYRSRRCIDRAVL